MVEDGKIVICHIPSSDNLADVFTKLPLGRDAHRRACIGMRLILIWQDCQARESIEFWLSTCYDRYIPL